MALAFTEIARYPLEAENFDEVLSRIVHTAVATVTGCGMASVTLQADGSRSRTAAATDAAALAADQAQFDAGEGPCLDALDDAMVYAPEFPDER